MRDGSLIYYLSGHTYLPVERKVKGTARHRVYIYMPSDGRNCAAENEERGDEMIVKGCVRVSSADINDLLRYAQVSYSYYKMIKC